MRGLHAARCRVQLTWRGLHLAQRNANELGDPQRHRAQSMLLYSKELSIKSWVPRTARLNSYKNLTKFFAAQRKV